MTTHARRYSRIREHLTARQAARHTPRHRRVTIREVFQNLARSFA